MKTMHFEKEYLTNSTTAIFAFFLFTLSSSFANVSRVLDRSDIILSEVVEKMILPSFYSISRHVERESYDAKTIRSPKSSAEELKKLLRKYAQLSLKETSILVLNSHRKANFDSNCNFENSCDIDGFQNTATRRMSSQTVAFRLFVEKIA